MASKHGIEKPQDAQKKSALYGGLAEVWKHLGVRFILPFCPKAFCLIASVFALICWVTAIIRIWVALPIPTSV